MNIGDLYTWFNILAKKQLSGAIKPDDFNIALNAVNIDFFALKIGLPDEYQPGLPLPRQAYEVTTRITDDIKHLRKKVPVAKDATTQLFLQPSDYGAFSSLRYPFVKNQNGMAVAYDRNIDMLTDEEYNYAVGAALSKPSLKKPKACYLNGGWEVKPDTIQLITLTYLRFPNTPVRAYTVVNDEDIYSPGPAPGFPNGSTQLDWPVTCHNDFIIRLGKYFGLYLREDEMVRFLDQRQFRGQ